MVTESASTGVSTLRLYLRAIKEVRKSYLGLAFLLLLGLLRMPLTLLTPAPLKIVVDNVIDHRPLPPVLASIPMLRDIQATTLLSIAVAIFIAISFANFLHAALEWGLRESIGQAITNRFRSRLFQHVFHLSLARYETEGIGSAIYAIEQNGSALQAVIAENFILLITAFVTFAGMLVVLAMLNINICFVAAITSPPLIAITYFFDRHLRTRWQNVHTSERASLSLVREVMSALCIVKLFGNEHREHGRFCLFSEAVLTKQRKTLIAEALFKSLIGIILAISSAIIFYTSAREVMEGHMTVGDMMLIMAYASMIYGPLHLLSTRMLGQQRAIARLDEAFFVLDQPSAIFEVPNTIAIRRFVGSVEFRGVEFHYRIGQTILTSVDFAVSAGSRVGIFGESGSGKTTLVSLLLRLYDPTKGCILIDDIDIRNYCVSDLRAQFAVLPQKTVLFERSIAENIDYGSGVSRADVIRAAKMAGADTFIKALPYGYDTVIGEGGFQLSGGELQRLALARMFVRDRPILILDEPTNALDDENAKAILKTLYNFSRNRTMFIISHDLCALQICDLILEVKSSRVHISVSK